LVDPEPPDSPGRFNLLDGSSSDIAPTSTESFDQGAELAGIPKHVEIRTRDNWYAQPDQRAG